MSRLTFELHYCQLSISNRDWGETKGKEVYLYTLSSDKGMIVIITNYGCIITSILVHDRNGKLEDVLGFDNLKQYLEPNPCFGATIGRFANRIRNASFNIGLERYQLTRNDDQHCIHGGNEFDRVVWESDLCGH